MSEETTTKELNITISTDDRLFALVDANIRNTSHEKTPDNVIRLFTLLASGYTKSAACKMTGISRHNLTRWCREQWYKESLDIIKEKMDEELDSSYTAIIHKGARETADRLDNGDWIMDRDGNQVRKPMSGREAMLITGIAHDKRALNRGKPTSITENISADQRLDMLAERFKAMAIEAEFVEIESNDEETD